LQFQPDLCAADAAPSPPMFCMTPPPVMQDRCAAATATKRYRRECRLPDRNVLNFKIILLM
jgi:hypothetical protein